MSKVILSGYIQIPLAELETVRQALPEHIVLSREEPGCIVFEVIADNKNPCCYQVYEEFINQDAFDNHQQRVRNSVWGDVSKNVKRCYQISAT